MVRKFLCGQRCEMNKARVEAKKKIWNALRAGSPSNIIRNKQAQTWSHSNIFEIPQKSSGWLLHRRRRPHPRLPAPQNRQQSKAPHYAWRRVNKCTHHQRQLRRHTPTRRTRIWKWNLSPISRDLIHFSIPVSSPISTTSITSTRKSPFTRSFTSTGFPFRFSSCLRLLDTYD